MIHGMGGQRPLDTLTRFVDSALEPDVAGKRQFYSRPESVTGSFESRRFLAPYVDLEADGDGTERVRPQTEFFEYHWADKMQGNRLDDLWPTFRRMVLCRPTRVPAGLRGVWLAAWLVIVGLGWAVGWGPLSGVWRPGDDLATSLVASLVSGALASAALSYVVSRLLPLWLTASFVDVVRYLDTSPRSYGVRRDIRKGLVEMLQALHARSARGDQHYDRIVIVAHSLGAYIAYDAIAYLWGLTNAETASAGATDLAGLDDLEQMAHAVERGESDATNYQDAQALLFEGLRATGNPWLITDFVSVGTPMYFADRLLPGKGALGFERRKERHELPTCPPLIEEEGNGPTRGRTRYSWRKKDGNRQVLHEGAPFAVVRWTNVFFPTRGGFLGDWFGGALAPLFGAGIRDVEVTGNTPQRLMPAWAHSLYFSFPDDVSPDSVTEALRDAMGLPRRKKTRPAPGAVAGSGTNEGRTRPSSGDRPASEQATAIGAK
ncbi:hypothetical protein [Phycicoccus avicenniae]|uniref:hypothetical protein n=1 Tax=Phycicoccus avicenniae TaxID=2828860 RepID=UPI003D2D52D3